MSASENYDKVKSLQKALNVLDCFTDGTPELGVSEIARMLGLNKSNVYNILSTFEAAGYIQKNPVSEKYMLGNKMVEFSYTVMSTYKYTNILLPTMNKLSDDLGTVSYFGILHGNTVLYLFSTYPYEYAKSISYRSILGETAPLYCTSLGKALLSTMTDEEVLAHLPKERVKYMPNTLTGDREILEDIALVRERGYSIDNMEHEPNIRCAGVPILGRNGELIGALSASGPTANISPDSIDKIAQRLLSAVYEIRMQM